MSDADASAKPTRAVARSQRAESRQEPAGESVLQVERLDYTDLAPTDRPRSQGLRGFEDCYTDIVDYIVRCTHRIWTSAIPA